MSGPLPLEGVRLITIEHFAAGPYASQHLCEMGAEVIKIEAPEGGDYSRQVGPFFFKENESLFFQPFNHGKKSLALDLRAAEGKAIFRRLAATADAVLNNLRGDQPEKLGLTYAALSALKPALVCAHISGYGREGERAAWPAYDFLMQAEAGFMAVTGEPGTGPNRVGLSLVDYMTGATMAFALTAALLGALKTGKGRDIDVSLYDVAVHQLTYPAAWYLNEGFAIERRPRSGHPVTVPCEMFEAEDGPIFIMAMTPKFWENLCAALERPDLPGDARFATPEARLANRDALAAIIDPLMRGKPVAQWMARFAGKVPAAPVLGLKAALDNPFLGGRGARQTFDHPLRPGWTALASPVRPDGEPVRARPAPMLGQHTDEILGGLGIGAAERRALRDKGVVA